MRIFLTILIILWCSGAWGATYYISSSGVDTNNGTTTETSWAHHPWDSNATNTALATNLTPDDQILYKKGDTFTNVMLSPNESGTDGHPIITGSYGTGDKPILSASSTKNNVIYLYGRPGVNDVNYLTFQDLYLKDPAQSYGSFFAPGGMTGITLQRCTIESATTNNYLAAYIGGNTYGDPEDVLIDSNIFILKAPGNSAAGLSITAIDTSSNVIVSNNTFQSTDTAVVANGIGILLDTSNAIEITQNDINDSSNRFYYGIKLTNADSNDVHNNNVDWCWDGDDYPDGDGYGIYIELSSEANNIRRNTLYRNNKGIFLNSNSGNSGNLIAFNIVKSSAVNGIDNQDSTSANASRIYNNTIYHNPTNNKGHGISVQVDGKKADIKNNIVYNINSAAGPHCIFLSTSYAAITLSNNVYWITGSGYIGGDDSGNYSTLATWQTAISDDAAITIKEVSSIMADPLFTDAAGGNFFPLSTSPVMGQGQCPFVHGDGDQYDMAGNLIWSDTTDAPVGPGADGWEIGAYQRYQAYMLHNQD